MGLNSKRNTDHRAARRSGRATDLLTMKPSDLRAGPRGRDLDDLPGSDDLAEPGAHDRTPADRGGPAAPRRDQAGRALEGARAAEGGRHPAGRDAHRRLPAPVLGRHAPARDDRDGADQRPRPADRRRADDRARRDDAGADPLVDEDAAGGLRQRDHHDHARPRRRRRDRGRRARHVRGERRRAGRGTRPLQPAAAPVHVGLDGLAAAPRGRRRAARRRSPASRRRCSTRRTAAASIRAART